MENNEEKLLVQLSSGNEVNETFKDDLKKEVEKPGLIDKEDLVVIKKLFYGGCGWVYDATYKNKQVVVKTSLAEGKDKFILQEYKFLENLQQYNIRGIPKIGPSFVQEERQSFIVEKLGEDLFEIKCKTAKDKFLLETTVKVALQVLQILKHVHDCGILHNDIKPENLMTGLSDQNTIYLIDFGYSTFYMKDGKHVADEYIGTSNGTHLYKSINSLKLRNRSRKDDLESLAYNLVELLTGKLPWEDIVSSNELSEKEKNELVIEKEKPAAEICSGMPNEFADFLHKVRSLKFDQKPEYDKYCETFEKLLSKNESHSQIDWK